MTLLTALRWINGFTLLAALSLCVALAAFQWLGRFARSAAQTAWNTGVLFASGFQKNNPTPVGPSIDGDLIAAVITFSLLAISLLMPQRHAWLYWWLHASALAATLLGAWSLWAILTAARTATLAPAYLAVILLWMVYYWAAAWRAHA